MHVVLLSLLAAASLSVRVLEREKPVRAHLEAKELHCDGRALPGPVDLEAAVREVRAGKELCGEVLAQGDLRLTVGALERRYPGRLQVVLEGEFLRFINEVDVEEYLPSVVQQEQAGAPAAALEAQAVVSRTFSLTGRRRHGKAGYDLCDLTHCQLYTGRGGESAEARAAVEKTRGQVLLVGGVVLRPAFFHAACGGHTSRAVDVFHEDGAGPGVSDLKDGAPLCKDAPDFSWEWTLGRAELAQGLHLNPRPDVSAFEVLRRDDAGRVLELKSFGKRFTGQEFQSAVGHEFGWQKLKSLKVTSEEVESRLHFTGQGIGHGVGLCQQGARALAQQGATARAILQRYFPDSQVKAAPE